jgi:Zn-finger nucleic acid-binding protein
MKCPVCQEVDLVISDRQGVEIDYCPQCRGVWLDRGELDKIIERSAALVAPRSQERHDDDDDWRDKDRSRRDQIPRKKKRESFLSELFDF